MPFNKELLHYFLEDALRKYSENFRIFDTKNPVKIILNDKKYSIHISYVHDSGNTRTNEDEARIQISRSMRETQRSVVAQGYIAAFIGFYERGGVFVGWEPAYIFSGQSNTISSVYANKSHQATVNQYGAALKERNSPNLGRNYATIALPDNALGIYLENIDLFHQIHEEKELRQFINNNPELVDGSSKYTEEQIPIEVSIEGRRERRTIISKRVAYPRNPKFTKDVFSAYGGACAICLRQLGIVQAAHIIPHNHDDCRDVVANGIALCVEHHALYDGALLMPHTNNRLYLNQSKIDFLTETGQSNGIDAVRERAGHGYTVPENKALQPSQDFLDQGVKIRLGQVA